ncbi:MAG: hypothetical protein L0221_10925 [Chloroflexi bacterium]|nr:hypothetical protein [Chloroflexota bacterium]
MTQLTAGRTVPRRRVLFGAFDADGWSWATVKALFWFVVIILLLGYIPDRAYYFTVNRTLEVGLLAWSPVNLCPPENGDGMPCPAPVGAVLPWQQADATLDLPAPRRDGALAQLGTRVLYIGGSDGSAAQSTVYLATIADRTFGAWSEGPALPAPRTDAAIAVYAGVIYLMGGLDGEGAPTTTIWTMRVDPDSGELGEWTELEGYALPEARSGATAAAISDGLVVLGGRDAAGAPTTSVWKSTQNLLGVLKAFEVEANLPGALTDTTAAQVGDFLWVYGGTDADGPVGAVLRGQLGTGKPPVDSRPGRNITPPGTEPDPIRVLSWAINNAANLPVARTTTAGFSANGVLYLVGGSDGDAPQSEMYWTVPNATGNLPGWSHLDVMDLPAGGLEAASPVSVGSSAFLIGGETQDGVSAGRIEANLAPGEPFFRLGIAGAVIPGMQIEGELGQQLGYLAADGVGTVNFIILLIIGWAYAHRDRVSAWWSRRRGRAGT